MLVHDTPGYNRRTRAENLRKNSPEFDVYLTREYDCDVTDVDSPSLRRLIDVLERIAYCNPHNGN